VKRGPLFYWLIGILFVSIVIAAAFYFDTPVANFMATHQSPGLRDLMRNVSRFGDWPEHFLVGLALFSFARWRGNKKWARIFLAMLIALAIAGLVGRAIKVTTGRARPSVRTEQRWHGLSWDHKYNSFPSGHVDASVGFFGVLFLARRRVGLACMPIPIIIGFSRMYLGAHYLSDVVCAAVLGIVAAVLVWRFANRRVEEESPNSR
jgi:membrane-associated phospholipid phosphatase